MKVVFGIFGAALTLGLMWLIAWLNGESVPTWAWFLATVFAYDNWADWWYFQKRTTEPRISGSRK